MRARVSVGVVACLTLCAGVAGCSDGSVGTAQSPTSAWPSGVSAALVPSGLTLVGGVGEGDVVVDGAGMAWVQGPWQVARVDLASGGATVWDAADDLAFVSVDGLAPAQPAGVWLDSEDRVRLFDGERFVVDIAIPAQFGDAPDDQVPAGEILQVGDELWASGPSGVGRWANGAWSMVGIEQLASAGPLALDSEGAVWAGGVGPVDGEPRNVVVRWDGQAWRTPGDAAAAPSGGIGDIAADPAGGVWVASTQDGPVTDQHGIFRFDGTTWRKVGPGGYAGDLSVTTGGQLWAMVGAGNGVDPSGEVRVARLADDGSWLAYGRAQGAPEGSEFRWPSLAVSADTVLVSDLAGLVRNEGDRFVTMWQDPAAVIQPAFEVSSGQVSDALLAVGADEVWLPATPVGAGPSGLVGSNLLSRFRAGSWEGVGPTIRGDLANSPALATDGAIWQATPAGLVRIQGDASSVVAPSIGGYERRSLAAGDDARVWTILDGDLVEVAPDGELRSVGRPTGSSPLWSSAALAAGGGVVWTTQTDARRGLARLARWDGRWSSVAVPEPYEAVTGLLVAPDGAVWATLEGGRQALGRYADGRWSIDEGGARGLAWDPGGHVCSIRGEQVACYPGTGPIGAAVSVIDVPALALSIAADGSAWVLGDQVARLAPGAIGEGS